MTAPTQKPATLSCEVRVEQVDRDRLRRLPAYLREQWPATLLKAFAAHRKSALAEAAGIARRCAEGPDASVTYTDAETIAEAILAAGGKA